MIRRCAPPGRESLARVLPGTARRITSLLKARSDGDEGALARDEPLLAKLRRVAA